MTRDKLLPALVIALLAIAPMILSGALFGQQPATPSVASAASSSKDKEAADKKAVEKAAADKAATDKAAADKVAADKAAADKASVDLELETQADCHHGPALRHEKESLTTQLESLSTQLEKLTGEQGSLSTQLAQLATAIAAKPANQGDLEKQQTDLKKQQADVERQQADGEQQQQNKTSRLAAVNKGLSESKDCELGGVLTVGLANLGPWVKSNPLKNKPQNLVLVLDGRVMKGLVARGPYDGKEELEFDLRRLEGDDDDSKANRNAWSALLGRSHGRPTINVGVALEGNPPYYGPSTITFRVLPRYWGLAVVFILLLLGIFFVLARRSDILRDGPSDEVGSVTSWRDYLKVWRASAAINKKSFSLARCQMAWWFFIIVAAYIWIWMVTYDHDSLTNGALVLMGISAATGLGAVLVDSSKDDQRQPLVKEQAALNGRLAELSTQIAVVPAPANVVDLRTEQLQKSARLEEVKTALASLPSPPGPSEGFLLDILRDETGVSFHRFQMAGWTVVLGFVFIVAVYRTLAMPDFSATLLALMSISSGTYLGFKIANPPKQ